MTVSCLPPTTCVHYWSPSRHLEAAGRLCLRMAWEHCRVCVGSLPSCERGDCAMWPMILAQRCGVDGSGINCLWFVVLIFLISAVSCAS